MIDKENVIANAIEQLDWYFNEDDGCASEKVTKVAYRNLKEIVLALLKEQEPKMVVKTTSTIRCPRCGKQITNRGATHREIHYCWKCGQAVKWDD